MKITEVLVAEHAIFLGVFEQIQRALPGCATLSELRRMAGIVEGLLRPHGETEANLAYVALDQALAERGPVDRLYQDHEEIDSRFHKLQSARDLPEAMRLLTEAVAAMRTHFEHEERVDFPLLEQTLMAETIGQLGTAWME